MVTVPVRSSTKNSDPTDCQNASQQFKYHIYRWNYIFKIPGSVCTMCVIYNIYASLSTVQIDAICEASQAVFVVLYLKHSLATVNLMTNAKISRACLARSIWSLVPFEVKFTSFALKSPIFNTLTRLAQSAFLSWQEPLDCGFSLPTTHFLEVWFLDQLEALQYKPSCPVVWINAPYSFLKIFPWMRSLDFQNPCCPHSAFLLSDYICRISFALFSCFENHAT